ncbi:MAG: helix-turn-helix domain-containing protein [Acidimicrobiales bacterium]
MSIGEFARDSRLSAKALRLYDELGLLPPALVDEVSGYRFYEPGQLKQARLIAALRELQFPLAEIKAILPLEGVQAAERVSEVWAATEAGHTTRRALAAHVIDELSGKRPVMRDVSTRDIPERALLCVKRNVTSQKAAWAFGKEFIALLRQYQFPEIPGRVDEHWCSIILMQRCLVRHCGSVPCSRRPTSIPAERGAMRPGSGCVDSLPIPPAQWCSTPNPCLSASECPCQALTWMLPPLGQASGCRCGCTPTAPRTSTIILRPPAFPLRHLRQMDRSAECSPSWTLTGTHSPFTTEPDNQRSSDDAAPDCPRSNQTDGSGFCRADGVSCRRRLRLPTRQETEGLVQKFLFLSHTDIA